MECAAADGSANAARQGVPALSIQGDYPTAERILRPQRAGIVPATQREPEKRSISRKGAHREVLSVSRARCAPLWRPSRSVVAKALVSYHRGHRGHREERKPSLATDVKRSATGIPARHADARR